MTLPLNTSPRRKKNPSMRGAEGRKGTARELRVQKKDGNAKGEKGNFRSKPRRGEAALQGRGESSRAWREERGADVHATKTHSRESLKGSRGGWTLGQPILGGRPRCAKKEKKDLCCDYRGSQRGGDRDETSASEKKNSRCGKSL